MAPIIPAGGKRMNWVPNPEPVAKKAQGGMFDDDPQLQAIKDLPGMKDGIDELQSMSVEEAPCDQPPCEDGMPGDIAGGMPGDIAGGMPGDIAGGMPGGDASPVAAEGAPAGGAVEQAIEKVKDAAQGVADAAVKDIEKAVTDAVHGAGKPKVEEIKPETPKGEKKEKHEKSETPKDEAKEEKGKDKDGIPGIKDDGPDIEKEGCDASKTAAAAPKFRRIAELAPGELKDLRHYWETLLGFPKDYVDAMLKNYKS